MFEDVAINGFFEVSLDHRGGLKEVSGRSGFEQSLVLHLTERFETLIGESIDDSIEELARVEAWRIVDSMDMVEAVSGFEVERDPNENDVILLTIVYNTGDMSELEVDT